jgi:hypothetical protein
LTTTARGNPKPEQYRSGMLEGLDDVDWRRLKGAYGAALDVPSQLRAMAKTNRAGRREIYEGFDILHQGSVYEATAHAVPFLFEIARAPDVADRDEIVEILALVARAEPPPASSFGVARRNPFTGQIMPGTEGQTLEAARAVVAAHAALVAREGEALALLDDAVVAVRAEAALLLSRLRACAERSVPAIRAAAKKPDAPRVAYLLALARLADATPETRTLAADVFATSRDAKEKLAAAYALAFALREATPDDVHALLVAAKDDRTDPFYNSFEGGEWEPAVALEAIGR